ncbi:SDR family NAD(P)-dependent oxidoreductase [Ectobacillus panaciterrae]|uniref:SDR family NAD(P)-dependent oxidoreductase n=1 Tax=Ectobacillus panaciterrae TaxID=363872 RepID=UPI0003FA6F94|nr:SDR family NAD(P)-dependent oxidoreductase [Ectobacillus panaciterrae]
MSFQKRIAIVGMSCRVPGANTLQEFWEMISNENRAIGKIPLERFDAEIYRACWGMEGKGEMLGGLVDASEIDYRKFPIPPEQIRHMHPMEKIGLSVMHEALQDAGIERGTKLSSKGKIYIASNTFGPSPETDHGPCIRQGEFTRILEEVLNRTHPDIAKCVCDDVLALHKQTAPPIRPDTMTTSASLVAGRIANLYDMQGGHAAVDAGICSSLAATAEAVLALQQDACDFALVAGISPLVTASSIVEYLVDPTFSEHIPILGEGGAAFILMREEDVGQRRVYAYIEGIASSLIQDRINQHDIATAAAKAAVEALKQLGATPDSVTRIESRNIGLSFWEKAELEGLSSVYGVQQIGGDIPITSCVPHIGFLQAASGMTALVRAALALFYEKECKKNKAGLAAVSDVGIAPVAYHALLSAPADSARHQSVSVSYGPDTEPIAIVGMGAIVPGAKDIETFWKHTKLSYRSIGDLPERKWSFDKIIGNNEELRLDVPSKLAGVVQIPGLDLGKLGIYEKELSRLDEGVIFSLLCGIEAAEQAGLIDTEVDKDRVSVLFGQLPIREAENAKNKLIFFTDYMKLVRTVLQKQDMSHSMISSVLNNVISCYRQENSQEYDFLLASTGLTNAHYVAKALKIGGGILSVDATCASSFAAVEAAVNRLRANLADAVIVGGVSHHIVPEYNLTLHALGALSSKGIPPFHEDSDGFVPAEGAGAVVLKRLSDAVRDNNQIYAVIGGIGCSSDGKGTSVLAPSSQGQKRAIERALQEAGVRPEDLEHIEAHGTGTRLGDETEMNTYRMVFGEYHKYKPYSIGAVKSQIGHLSSAAGIIGLIKTTLALHEKIIPPSYTDGRSPLLLANLATEPRVWGSREDNKRRAGVSAFGLGGINYFLVVEEWQKNREDMPDLFSQPLPRPLHPQRADRFTVELVPVSLPARPALFPLRGKRLVLVQDVASKWRAYKTALEQRGAAVFSVSPFEMTTEDILHENLALWEREHGELTGILDLRTLEERPDIIGLAADSLTKEISSVSDFTFMLLRYFYDRFEQAPPLTVCYVAVTCLGGNLGLTDCDYGNVLGAFLQGLLKSLKPELPNVLAKTIDFPAHESIESMIPIIIQEIEDGNERTEVAYTDRRYVVHHKQSNFFDQTPLARKIRKGDIYLFSGGGRGVVFECAAALSLLGAKVIVCGRTKIRDESAPWLEMDDLEFAAYKREQLIKQRQMDPSLTPAHFKKEFSYLVKERELYQNMKKAKRLGIIYEVCDINDANQVHNMVSRILQRYGRIDGVVHGAMVEWSTIIPKKTKEMIDRTIETKVMGMCHLLDATKDIPLQSFICFGSGAGRFGNKGQSDYSAANSLMSALFVAKCRERKHLLHHTTLNWTAWESVGAAVADPAMTEALKNNGVPFISTEEGVYWFLSELALGRDRETVIVRERFLREWVFVGPEADGRKERSLSFQDRSIPVNPGDWPFIDTLMEKNSQKAIIEREIDREKDCYLEQHCLDGIPIFPMVCYLELLAEAAAVTSPGWIIRSVQQFEVLHAIKLFSDKPVRVRAEASVTKEKSNEREIFVKAFTDLSVKGRILYKDRVNASAAFTFIKQRGNLEQRTFPAVKGAAYSSVHYNVHRDTLQIGPLFCRAGEYTMNETEGIATAEPPEERKLFSFTNAPTLQADPFLIDIAMQIAVSVDSFHSSEVSLPISIGTVLFGRRRGVNERVKVYSRIVRQDGTDIIFDIWVIGENGDAIMEIQKFLARRIKR